MAESILSMALFIFFIVAISGKNSQSQQLVAGTLQMYVDELPQMPNLYGYTKKNGVAVSVPLTIGMYSKIWKFHRDLPPTPVFVFGTSPEAATFPGPTIIAQHGTPLPVTWQNHLPKNHILPWDRTVPTAIPKNGGVPTVVHLHGSVHPPQSDGSALAWFTAGFAETGPKWSQATYTYPNVQPPGNLWYHDHALGLTRVNLLAGLLGAYIVHKPTVDDPLDLPQGPEFDRHLIIVDRSFNTDGSLYMNATGNNPGIHPQWQPEYFADAIIVNGKAWPYINVRRRRYRFRIINASNARYYRLSLSNGLPFYVVGSDSSYLAAPVTMNAILLAPAEIADVVVDFSNATTTSAELINDAPYPYPTGTPAGPINGKVMKFNIVPGKPETPDDSHVPEKEVNYANVTTGDATVTRYTVFFKFSKHFGIRNSNLSNRMTVKYQLTYSSHRYITLYEYMSSTGQSTHLYINGLRFEDTATETPRSGSTELWQVINLTGDNHPLHIHLGMFQAIKVQELLDLSTFQNCMTAVNDAVKCNIASHAVGKLLPIPDHERTWKNVVKIEPGYMTTIVIKFKLVDTNQTYPFDVTAEPGYVYHCHILDHEDNAMIRPLKMLP